MLLYRVLLARPERKRKEEPEPLSHTCNSLIEVAFLLTNSLATGGTGKQGTSRLEWHCIVAALSHITLPVANSELDSEVCRSFGPRTPLNVKTQE